MQDILSLRGTVNCDPRIFHCAFLYVDLHSSLFLLYSIFIIYLKSRSKFTVKVKEQENCSPTYKVPPAAFKKIGGKFLWGVRYSR